MSQRSGIGGEDCTIIKSIHSVVRVGFSQVAVKDFKRIVGRKGTRKETGQKRAIEASPAESEAALKKARTRDFRDPSIQHSSHGLYNVVTAAHIVGDSAERDI